jgi:hypothetical protein
VQKRRFPTIWEVVENYPDFVASGWWRLRRSGVCGRSGVKAFSCLESRIEYRLIPFRSYNEMHFIVLLKHITRREKAKVLAHRSSFHQALGNQTKSQEKLKSAVVKYRDSHFYTSEFFSSFSFSSAPPHTSPFPLTTLHPTPDLERNPASAPDSIPSVLSKAFPALYRAERFPVIGYQPKSLRSLHLYSFVLRYARYQTMSDIT